MKRLVVTGSFPFATHTFVIREVASAHAGGDDIFVLAPDDGDKIGDEFRAKLGFPADRAIYLNYTRCAPFSLDPNWLRGEINRAGMRGYYGWLLAGRRKTFFCKLISDPRLRNLDLIHAHFAAWAFNVAAPLADILRVPLTIGAHDAELFPKHGQKFRADIAN